MNTRVCLALAILALGLLVPTVSAKVPPPVKTICTGTVCLDIVTHPPGRPPVLEQQAFGIGGFIICRRC